MSSRAATEWKKYGINGPEDTDAGQFKEVYHTAHLKDAIRICEDGVIRSSLVWDQSVLRNSRTCVSWVSPNTWAYGSIYGNIQFGFSWNDLIDNRSLYWVEGVDSYRPPAYRILVSHRKPETVALPRFDATLRGGPVFFDKASDQWVRNLRFTGEFLIDADLQLGSDCTGVDFVSHHPEYCRRYHSDCGFLGISADAVGARFVAAVIAAKAVRPKELFLDPDTKHKRARFGLYAAYATLLNGSDRLEASGGLKSTDEAALSLATAIFHRIGQEGLKSSGVRRLCALFRNSKERRAVFEKRIMNAFGLSSLNLEDLD